LGVENSGADADDILRELDMTGCAARVAADLGYGEQRRLDLALALVGRPTVILLDEPMAGLSVHESLSLPSICRLSCCVETCRCCWSSTTWISCSRFQMF